MTAADRDGPIYIGGPDRCGKTLVAALLGSHSRLAIPIVGSNLWSFFYEQHGDLADDGSLDRCLAALQRYKHARFLGLDLERLRSEMRAGEPTYPRLFALVHEHFAERMGKPRWGDQTGLVERYADEIFAAYPGVRMVHMVRDPRDRYEASLRLWPKGRGRAGGAVARWRYSMALGERNARRYGARYRLQRYEDLVGDPERITRELCEFVGEEFEPRMMELPDAPTYRRKLEADPGESSLISSHHVGAFRGRVPEHEVAFMQQQLGGQMRRLGYVAEPIRMAPMERMRYLAVRWPTLWARMVAWQATEAIQHRLAGLVGRRPSPGKVVRDG